MEIQIHWDERPDKNVDHIARHGVKPSEVEEILRDDTIEVGISNTTGKPQKEGRTSTGKLIRVIFMYLCENPPILHPITAHTLEKNPPPAWRRNRRRR